MKNVYEVVDEDTYVDTVNERLKNDWIVDDGTGIRNTEVQAHSRNLLKIS